MTPHPAPPESIFSLRDRVAVVVGGTAGIGHAAAEVLRDLGAHVYITGRGQEQGARVAAESGLDYVPMDVTDSASVDAAVQRIAGAAGRLDIAVNGAGLGLNKPTETVEDEEFARVVDVNFGGVFRCCRAEARVMLEQGSGSIINIASMSGYIVNDPQRLGVYNASKAAVIHYTRSLAVEWADRGIRVNSISPGYTATAMTAVSRADPERVESWRSLTPLGRIGEPGEMAGAIAYLASDAASFATGTDIVIDGGYRLR